VKNAKNNGEKTSDDTKRPNSVARSVSRPK
jgi:hypothetical protein